MLINKGELKRKLPKVFAGKTYKCHKKASRADLIKKNLTLCVKKDSCAAAKHKIILSWPQNLIFYVNYYDSNI